MQTVAVALIHSIRQQAYWKIAVRRANDFSSANQQRRDVAAVDELEFAIVPKPGNDHRRILFADTLAGEKAVGAVNDVGQRHARNQLGINHSLES